jgi:hypothetical protein
VESPVTTRVPSVVAAGGGRPSDGAPIDGDLIDDAPPGGGGVAVPDAGSDVRARMVAARLPWLAGWYSASR